jgi:serine/threonine protein kinase/tetratricopeptide (TPR) repeat protein
MKPASPEQVLFAEALHRATPEARAAYLDAACGTDAALRRRVEGLLRAAENAGDFLEQPPTGLTADATTTLLVGELSEKAGDRIGRYKLLEQIGEGGCGTVYMAEQEEPVRRRVALKVIKLGMDTKQVIARFEAERQALALMDHPNIAKVLDGGATPTGRPYFVMELVRGVRITEFCDEAQLSTAARLRLFVLVCQAVQHAHQKGIIHRDLKPSNILVTVNDGAPVPKVIDFGIAKATGQRLTDKSLFTQFHSFIGTPAYTSPEQAEMSSVDIDTRSDIYSLGVLLYELLIGRTPFDGEELLRSGLDEMRRILRETEPLRPSTRLSTLPADELTTSARRRHTEPPKLIHLVSGDLDWIVMKALEKDRTRRYETASGLAGDVQRHLNNEPVVARPPSNFYRLQKSVQRNKLAFGAATAVALALVIGLAISTAMFFKGEAEKKRAQAAAAKSEQVAQFLKDMLNGVGPSSALGRDTAMLREILDKTVERVGKDLKDQPGVEAELRSTIGEVYFALGQYEQAETMHRAALALRTRLLGDEHPDTATTLNALGIALDYQRRGPEAESILRKALGMRRKLFGNEHADVATSLHNLGHALAYQQKCTEAEDLYREALAMRRKLLGNENLDVAETLVQWGSTLRVLSRFAEADLLYQEALTLRRKLLGNEHPAVAHALDNWAISRHYQGNFAEAESMYRQVLAMRTKLMGNEHPLVASTRNNLITVLERQGKVAEAEELIDGLLKQTSDNKSEKAKLLALRGGRRASSGRWTEAAADFSKAAELAPDSEGDAFGAAIVMLKAGRHDEYRRVCHRYLQRASSKREFLNMDISSKVSLLLPVDGQDFQHACELADFAATALGSNWLVRLGKSLADYRRQRFDSANDWAGRNISDESVSPGHKAGAYFMQALILAQSQQMESARRAFESGDALIKPAQNVPTGGFADSWRDLAIAELLGAEARSRLEGQTDAVPRVTK